METCKTCKFWTRLEMGGCSMGHSVPYDSDVGNCSKLIELTPESTIEGADMASRPSNYTQIVSFGEGCVGENFGCIHHKPTYPTNQIPNQ